MSTLSKFSWIISAIAVSSLFLLAGCFNNGPILPDNSDVLFFDGGGDIPPEEINALVELYDGLEAGGGGAGYTEVSEWVLIGAFDRWTGDNLEGLVLITPDEGPVLKKVLKGATLIKDLQAPFTVSFFAPNHVSKTLVSTSANVIAFGCEARDGYNDCNMRLDIVTEFDGEPINPAWFTVNKSTRLAQPWTYSYGNGDTVNKYPYASMATESYHPVGMVTLLYVKNDFGGINPTGFITDPLKSKYALVGYWYKNAGELLPQETASWQNEFDLIHLMDYGTFEGIIDFSQSGNQNISTLLITSGGLTGASCEFIPFGPAFDAKAMGDSKTYYIEAFEPVQEFDKTIVFANLQYAGGGGEMLFTEWTEAFENAPQLIFHNRVKMENWGLYEPDGVLFGSWDSLPFEGGLQEVRIMYNGNPWWDIILDGTSEPELPAKIISLPEAFKEMNIPDTVSAYVRLIECESVNVSDWSNAAIWQNTTTARYSAPVDISYQQ